MIEPSIEKTKFCHPIRRRARAAGPARAHIPLLLIGLLAAATGALAQGQDSTTWERDRQVIATLLPGGFDNANQRYFDRRAGRDVTHRALHVDISALDDGALLVADGYWDRDSGVRAGRWLWALSAVDDAVAMRSWRLGADDDPEAVAASPPQCVYHWNREAAQFRAHALDDCGDGLPRELVLSERQLWMTYAGDGQDYRLHRVRWFECYADIPGVGGGRDEPYDRYEGFRIHDMGDQAWFTSKEGRRLGISLFLVDWPINNYEGVFTRDSFVIYVSEETGEERREHGYAFTVPDADRIGINLKWMLASCYMTSNRVATPTM